MANNSYLGSIQIFGFNFAPRGFAMCNGQVLSISQNTALFSLLGTYYGGNGSTTFQLPNLQSRVPVHIGQGAGLSQYVIGQNAGTESVTLTTGQLPAHNHGFNTLNVKATSKEPASGSYLARATDGGMSGDPVPQIYVPTGTNGTAVPLNFATISATGNSQPHSNIQPYLALNFCIALQGIYPSRS